MVFAARDKWRTHPLFQTSPRTMLPGLKNATIIFAAYCAVEFVYNTVNAPPPRFDPSKLEWSKSEVGTKPEVDASEAYTKTSHSHHGSKSYKWEKSEVGVKPQLVSDE